MLAVSLLALSLSLVPPAVASLSVQGYLTTTDRTKLLAPITLQGTCAGAGGGGGLPQVVLNASATHQRIAGYGAAMTDSSAALIANFDDAEALLNMLFNPYGGVGLSLLRVPIGMSDFSLSLYTFDDSPGDYALSNFSVAHDLKYTIPLLLRIQKINPDLRLILTPWTAPTWLKQSGSRGSGPLVPSAAAYDAFAEYLVRSAQAYHDAGLNVAYLTVQNEPLHDNCGNMPCMSVSPQQGAELGVRVGMKLAARNLSTMVLAYDHNWDTPQYPIAVLSNATANRYVGGTAFHCYAGDVSAQASVYNLFPDKPILLTECCGGDWAPESTSGGSAPAKESSGGGSTARPRAGLGDFAGNLNWELANYILGGANYFAAGSVYWNVALDENHGPKTQDVGGCTNCRGVVTVPSTATALSQVTFNSEFYALAAASKVVPINSTRIDVTLPGALSGSAVVASAFVTPNGELSLVVANGGSSQQLFTVVAGDCSFNVTLPEGVVSLTWSPPPARRV
jgi:glucosylceramidase